MALIRMRRIGVLFMPFGMVVLVLLFAVTQEAELTSGTMFALQMKQVDGAAARAAESMDLARTRQRSDAEEGAEGASIVGPAIRRTIMSPRLLEIVASVRVGKHKRNVHRKNDILSAHRFMNNRKKKPRHKAKAAQQVTMQQQQQVMPQGGGGMGPLPQIPYVTLAIIGLGVVLLILFCVFFKEYVKTCIGWIETFCHRMFQLIALPFKLVFEVLKLVVYPVKQTGIFVFAQVNEYYHPYLVVT